MDNNKLSSLFGSQRMALWGCQLREGLLVLFLGKNSKIYGLYQEYNINKST